MERKRSVSRSYSETRLPGPQLKVRSKSLNTKRPKTKPPKGPTTPMHDKRASLGHHLQKHTEIAIPTTPKYKATAKGRQQSSNKL